MLCGTALDRSTEETKSVLGGCHLQVELKIYYHCPSANCNPDLEARLSDLESRDALIASLGSRTHGSETECRGVDERKGVVDVRVPAQGNVLGLHVSAFSLMVPAFIVSDGALVRALTSALRVGYRAASTEIWRRAAKSKL